MTLKPMKDILMGIALFIVATSIVSHIDVRPKEAQAEQGQSAGSKQVSVEADIVLNQNADIEMEVMAPETENISKLAKEVIRGEWSNGAERKKRLTEAGYNYTEIQALVNKLIG